MRNERLVLVAVALTILVAAATATAGSITFVSPLRGDIPMGDTPIQVEVAGAEEGDRVEFFVNGRLVGSASAPPWKITWRASDVPREYSVSAVLLRNGREIESEQLRTRQVGFAAKANVRAVSLSPIVRDRSGRFVKNLRQDDFLVFEEGKATPIESFEATDSPLSVMLVLDTSGSMLLKMRDAKAAALKLLDALGPEDRVALLRFSSQVNSVTDFTKDKAAIRSAITAARAEGDTALYDATAAALRKLSGATGRRAVILFTDGEDNRSRLSVAQVIKIALAAEAPIYAIAQGTDESKTLRVFLDRLAEETAGRSYFIKAIKSLPDTFRDIFEELSNQYFLTFSPRDPSSKTWHQIEVKMAKPGLVVRARTGYILD